MRRSDFLFFELSLRCYETNARRTWHIALGPTDIPHTRRPRARPTPAGRKGSDSLGRRQPEYVESWLNNAGFKRGWSGSQVRLTRLELTIYRTEHFRPLAPNPSTSPRAAPRDLGRSRAISRNPGAPRHATPPHPTSPTAAPRYLGRSRSVARAAAHLLKIGRARLERRGSRARSVLAAPHSAPLLRRWRGPVRRRPARRVHRPPRRPLRAPLIFSPLGVTLALTQDPGDSLPPPPPTG